MSNTLPTTSFENDRWFTLNNGRIHADVRPVHASRGSFWVGGSWPPTSMMVLRGLRNNGYHHFSHEVASDVLAWSIENGMQGRDPKQPIEDVDLEGINVYAEYFNPQFERRRNRQGKAVYRLGQSGVKSGRFVGWSGAPVVNSLLEEYIGILPNAPENRIEWNISELVQHGTENIHLGNANVDLMVAERQSLEDPAVVTVTTDQPFTLTVHLGIQTFEQAFTAGTHEWEVGTYQAIPGLAEFQQSGETSTDIDPKLHINGIRLGMSKQEVIDLIGADRILNQPLQVFGHHYGDRMTLFVPPAGAPPEEVTPAGSNNKRGKKKKSKPDHLMNVIFNHQDKAIMVWMDWAPAGPADDRLAKLSAEYGEPVAEWRHPEYENHQFIAWGDVSKDQFGFLDNGTNKPSLLMYNMGTGDLAAKASGKRIGRMRLWDPVGITGMRADLRGIFKLYVDAVQTAKQAN